MAAIPRVQEVLFLSKGSITLPRVKINWVPALALPFPISENFRSYLAFLGLIYKMKGHHRDQTHRVVVNIKWANAGKVLCPVPSTVNSIFRLLLSVIMFDS